MKKMEKMEKMKKILLVAILALLVSACNKDDAPVPTPPPTIEDLIIYFKISDKQTVAQAAQLVMETTGKQTVNGKVINVAQSTISARNEQEGKFTATVKGTISDVAFSKEYVFEGLMKESGSEEETTTPPTAEDLKSYFKISDDQTVAQAVELVTKTTGQQTVNGKVIDVTQSSVSARNEQEGKFTVTVKGTIDTKTFGNEYVFEGLVKKPSDYYMAIRAQVRWKAQFAKAPETTAFDFDGLYRLKQTEKFTTQYLSQWVELYSSNPEGGNIYIFTDEDLANTQLSEMKYGDGRISFVVSYKGAKGDQTSKGRPFLSFDKNNYYKQKVTLNAEKTKQYYMQGVYENLDLFYAGLINIDNKEVFVAELVSDSKIYDSNNNTINCTLSIATYENTDDELAKFEFKLEGFKPLTDLKQEWFLATSADLGDYMSSRFLNVADGDILEKIRTYPINIWMPKAQMVIQRNNSSIQLSLIKMTQNNIEVDAWRGNKGNLDILLSAPRFEVKSAQKIGNCLKLQVALVYVNDVALTDVVVPLEILIH